MSARGCYSDTVEDYIRDTIEVVVPEYSMWRPYFEFDIQRIIEDYLSNRKKNQYRAREQLSLLVERFVDATLPPWVREKILLRISGLVLEGHGPIFEYFMQEVFTKVADDPQAFKTVSHLRATSKLVRTIFEGVDFGN